ncbi:MAG: NADH-quinone oxidoreductase subunit M [Candidatus Verstraetearchaeota archaeon]|nr:NADH-quinone oxidoreductase subunit M [Candidatus Verstraetearchaeota archaeon]
MMIPCPLLQVILVPIIVAFLSIFLGNLGKRLGWIAFATLAYTSLIMIKIGIDLWNGIGPYYEEYYWSTALFNIKFGFLADGLSLPVALIMNMICAACALYSIHYMEHRIEQLYGEERKGMYVVYFSIYLLFAVGLVGVALSTNLAQMYVFTELTLIPSYIMIDLFGYVDRHRIAMMYFIWNHIGAAMFLIGIILAYIGTGSFEIFALRNLIGNNFAIWVCFSILVGWLVKMAVFGFHVWLPWAHGEHPTSIAAIIATIVGLGNYVIVRLLYGELFSVFKIFSIPLLIIAIITMIYGGFLSIAQDDMKRLYACSTISQTAYSILGIATLTVMGVVGGIFYFLSHILGKCVLFSVAGIVLCQTGIRDMRKLGGLARKMPLTATLCILGSMVLSAFPPLSGFQGEWIMFVGVFKEAGSFMGLTVALVAIFATFLTVIYTFWPVVRVFFGPLPSELENVKEAPLTMTLPLLMLMFIAFILGIYPESLVALINPVIKAMTP